MKVGMKHLTNRCVAGSIVLAMVVPLSAAQMVVGNCPDTFERTDLSLSDSDLGVSLSFDIGLSALDLLTCETFGGSGDSQLQLWKYNDEGGRNLFCRSNNVNGNDETDFSGVTLRCTCSKVPTPPQIGSCAGTITTQSGLSESTPNTRAFYDISVREGDFVTCTTSGGTGDLDLRIYNLEDDSVVSVCAGTGATNDEVCETPAAPADGTMRVTLFSSSPYTGASLSCSCSTTAAPSPASSACFSKNTMVEVEGLGSIQMDNLKIGDSVLTSSGVYSKVYSFAHFDRKQVNVYLKIQAEGINHPLEVSKDHLVYVYDASKTYPYKYPVAAQDINVGDFLVSNQEHPVQVQSIATISRKGVYAPLTETGNIVVSGVLASNYVTRDWMPCLVPGHTMHRIQHGGIMFYRIYCNWFSCDSESYDLITGYSPWVMLGFQVEEWVRKLHPVFRGFILIFAVLPVLLLDYCMGSFLMAPMWSLAQLALLGYISWKIGMQANKRSAYSMEMKSPLNLA